MRHDKAQTYGERVPNGYILGRMAQGDEAVGRMGVRIMANGSKYHDHDEVEDTA